MYHFARAKKEITGIQLQCIPKKRDTNQMNPGKIMTFDTNILSTLRTLYAYITFTCGIQFLLYSKKYLNGLIIV